MGDTKAFTTNALIEAALPHELKQINTQLTSLGLTGVVNKEKQYIGQAAEQTVSIAKPIVHRAIEQMTLQDAMTILSGGKGAATRYLKEKTQVQLISAIEPAVESKLKATGATTLIDNAFSKNNVLGSLATMLSGGKTNNAASSISHYASQQMVNGFFNVTENYENSVRNNPANLVNSVLNGLAR